MRPLLQFCLLASLAVNSPLVLGREPPGPRVPAVGFRDVQIEVQIVSMPEHLVVPALHDDKQIENAYAMV